MAELADALVLGTSGRPCRFESCYPHKVLTPVVKCREMFEKARKIKAL